MTEARVGFLFNAASCLSQMENKQAQTLLRSYYLLRCNDVAKTAALPQQYFSSKLRCSHCYTEWHKGTETTIRKRKLSKQQKRRLRQSALSKNDPKYEKKLSYDKILEQSCTFCKHRTITPLVKVKKEEKVPKRNSLPKENKTKSEKLQNIMKTSRVSSLGINNLDTNVYTSAKDIFSLKNKNNTLTGFIQKPAKVIKNNKKKKDKFAGLCQQAVLASAKLRDDQKKLNKLNLFLKPSL